MTTDRSERPNRFPWPPVLYGATIAMALAADQIVPLHPGAGWQLRAVGGAVLAGGLGLTLLAIVTLIRHRTTVHPDRGATTLVTAGPFGLSRNPIYLGNSIVRAGAAILFDLPWLAILLVPCTLLVSELAIRREEAHLAARFGEAWRAYAGRVRRWL